MQSNAELRGAIDHMLGRLAGALWVILALTFLIAGMGIANTLALNVHEQRRELALLRAVGLRRGQVQRVVLWQAVLMGLAGLAPGTLAGLGLAGLLCSSADPATRLACPLDCSLIVLCGMAGLVCCLFAALIPTRLYYHESID